MSSGVAPSSGADGVEQPLQCSAAVRLHMDSFNTGSRLKGGDPKALAAFFAKFGSVSHISSCPSYLPQCMVEVEAAECAVEAEGAESTKAFFWKSGDPDVLLMQFTEAESVRKALRPGERGQHELRTAPNPHTLLCTFSFGPLCIQLAPPPENPWRVGRARRPRSAASIIRGWTVAPSSPHPAACELPPTPRFAHLVRRGRSLTADPLSAAAAALRAGRTRATLRSASRNAPS